MAGTSKFWRKPLAGYDPWAVDKRVCCFREDVAERVVAFWETEFTLSKSGEPFKLEDWEKQLVGHLFGWKVRKSNTRRYRRLWLYVPRKNGKALELDTPIPTSCGWRTMRTVRLGDVVFSRSGKPCRVMHKSSVYVGHDCYEVAFSDGARIVADADHRWSVNDRMRERNRGRKDAVILTTSQIAESVDIVRSDGLTERRYSVPMAGPVEWRTKKLSLDPYTLGVWLGDGNAAGALFHSADPGIPRRIVANGVTCRLIGENCGGGSKVYSLSDGVRNRYKPDGYVLQILRKLRVLGNKHIPYLYQTAGVEQRMELLRGLMDTDGTCSKAGACSFCNVNLKLAQDFYELACSLGFKVTFRVDFARLNGGFFGTRARIQFVAYSDRSVFHLERKRLRLKPPPNKPTRAKMRQIVAVHKVQSRPVQCIAVDSNDHSYLAGRQCIPTHNTEMGAGLALIALVADHEPGAEVYSAASDTDQANLVFSAGKAMVQRNPRLAKEIGIFDGYKSMRYNASLSYWRVLSGAPKGKHGLNPHMYIVDEVHEQPNALLMETLETGTGARTQPLGLYMTTADYARDSTCNEYHDYAKRVRDEHIDDTWLPVIYELGTDADWHDEKLWQQVNPNLGVCKTIRYMREQHAKADKMPSYENTFKRLDLNIQTSAKNKWLSVPDWVKCLKPGLRIEDLEGEDCYAAVDMGSTRDMTACGVFFPDPMAMFCRFWVPEATAETKLEYQQWIKNGWLQTTPGKKMDSSYLRAYINDLSETHNLLEVGYDPWNASELALRLGDDDGIAVVEVRQGFKSLNEPSKRFEGMVLEHEFCHCGNPILRWMAGNVEVQEDPAGNIKPIKPSKDSPLKIDGIICCVMNVALWINNGEPEPDAYRRRLDATGDAMLVLS